ncbi:hypothetical protein J1N09_01455 [Aureitalea sp. L0-47]|uniref:hypothetical protein n=1 Tax=Aureitalea sp. L0-47 TaxID=2816962 RepID=UPI0022371FCE|nr:hypothetical protein [Aureitalea sp. L0-47]MCW5518486.1 hypothetical protein [Aureitalea sp. L0-47]
MNRTLLNIISSREDLSEYLFHFTSGKEAKDTLKKITSEKEIRDVNGKGVICFTEAPLLSLVQMFDIFANYENPMYAPYGIALKKDGLFEIGARPVIYGLPGEKDFLNTEIQWRFEPYEPNVKDFTWLREWRIAEKSVSINVNNCFVITKSKSDLETLMFNKDNIFDVEFDGCIADGQFWGHATGITERAFKGISIEDLSELTNLSKKEIDKKIAEQKDSDRGEFGLGSFLH